MIGALCSAPLNGAEASLEPRISKICVDPPRLGSARRNAENTHRVPRPWSRWLYNTWHDDVEGDDIRYAELVSDGLDPASGRAGLKLVLTLRRGGQQQDVILTLSEDQFDCPGPVCEVGARFDGGELQTYAARPAQNSSRSLTLIDAAEQTFMRNVKQADTLLLKTDLRMAAGCEFVFHTAGLRWP